MMRLICKDVKKMCNYLLVSLNSFLSHGLHIAKKVYDTDEIMVKMVLFSFNPNTCSLLALCCSELNKYDYNIG